MSEDIGKLIEPQPVAFTWGAPGWYVLAFVLLLCFLMLVLVMVRYYRRNKYRRDALSWLIEREHSLAKMPDVLVYDAMLLLKRIVMTRYGRAYASTRGREWISLLNRTSGSSLFSDTDAAWLTDALYVESNKITANEVSAYLNKTRIWIKRHSYAL